MSAFVFRDESSLRGAAMESSRRVGYVIEDEHISRVTAATLTAHAADLISIAMSCYSVDRLQSRGSDWARQLSVEIPVADPTFWRARASDIQDHLHLLTDDDWQFRFQPGRRARFSEAQLTLLRGSIPEQSAVALFSGGLDSLAGAARFLARSKGALLLVSARSSYVVGRDQRRLARELGRLWPQRVVHIHVPLRLRQAGDGEQSQRSRMFLFLVLAVVTAGAAGLSSVLVFENGVGSYNPRLAEFQSGAQANRSSHPRTLDSFSRLMTRLDMPIDLQLPHRLETKAEHVARIPEQAHPLIALTASCDSYPLRRPNATHCGLHCGSCILRRQSLMAADLERFDRTDYQDPPFTNAARSIAYGMAAWQAWNLRRVAELEPARIEALWPSLVEVPDEERRDVVRLFTKYGEEWEQIMRSRPHVAASVGWPLAVA